MTIYEIKKTQDGKIKVTLNGTYVPRADRPFSYALEKRAIEEGKNIAKHEGVKRCSLVDQKSVMPSQQEVAQVGEVMQLIKSAPSLKPDNLFMDTLTWKSIIRNVLKGKNTVLNGPTGCGKSQTAFAVAKALGREIFYVNLGATQDPRGTLVGNTHFNKETGTYFSESAFAKAIQKENQIILLDEVSRAHPEAWNILMTVLDENQRYLRLDEADGAPTIKVADGVSFIGTANIGSEYTSTRIVDRALQDRFITINLPYLSGEQETALINKLHPTIDRNIAKSIGDIADMIRQECSSDAPRITTAISTRLTLEFAEMITDGFCLEEVAEILLYPFYSEDGGLTSERTFIRQLVQKYLGVDTEEVEPAF